MMPARLFLLRLDMAELTEHVVFHIGQEFVVILVFVMMSVDVDDHHVVEVALMRLLARMRQQAAGVELLDRYAAAAISDEIHDVSPVSHSHE